MLPSDFFLPQPPPPPPSSTALLVPHHYSHNSSFSFPSSFSDAFFHHLSHQPLLDVHFQLPRPLDQSTLLSLRQMHLKEKDPSFLRPAHIQVACFAEGKNKAMRRQHQMTILPSLGSGLGSKGGFLKVCGGTGVFHPRVLKSSAATTTVFEAAEKQGVRSHELEDRT